MFAETNLMISLLAPSGCRYYKHNKRKEQKQIMQDIHTHLYWKSYDADRDVVVARARAAGVEEMLVIGCTVGESKRAIVVAEQ